MASFFIKSRYISLVNLLADTELFPEYLTWRDVSDELVRWALSWLDDPAARDEARESLATLRYHVARPGASDRAAATHRCVARQDVGKRGRASREEPERSPHFARADGDFEPTTRAIPSRGHGEPTTWQAPSRQRECMYSLPECVRIVKVSLTDTIKRGTPKGP